MVALLTISLGLLQAPAMTRAWTELTGYGTEVMGTAKGVAYFQTHRAVGAIRVSDGKVIWKKTLHGGVRAARLGSGFIVVAEGEEDDNTLHVFSMATGSETAKRATLGECTALAIDGSEIFALSAIGTIDSFDPKLRSKGSFRISPKPISRMSDDLAVTKDTILAGIGDQGFWAFDRHSGKSLWKKKDQYAALYPMVVKDGLVFYRGEHSDVCNARTGVHVWSPGQYTSWSYEANGTLVTGEDKGKIVGRNWKSGKVLWTVTNKSDGQSSRDAATLGADGKSFLVRVTNRPSDIQQPEISESLMSISPTGKVQWSTDFELPAYAGPEGWLVCDGERLLGYRLGAMRTVPADEAGKQKLAAQLVRDYEILDDKERDLLIPLARYATHPLLERYVLWAKEYEDREKSKKDDPLDRGQILYGLLEFPTARRLDKMLTKADTDALMDTIGRVESEWWKDRVLVPLMIQHGDVEKAAPFFIAQIRKNKDPEKGDSSIEVISRSKHPDAVKFMIEALGDPKAPEPWRYAAFSHLAGAGTEDAIRALRAAWPGKAPRKRWQDRVDFAAINKREPFHPQKDANGNEWVFFNSSVLGNGSDCFIAEKTAAGYGEPIYLGFFTRRVWDTEPPKTFRGVDVKKIVEGEWIKMFPGDAEIRKDSDGDGLTDLVEARMGTDAANADTDKDGMSDAVDPCPNAAPRSLGDREKIVEAAVAARFFEQDWGTPAVISVDKMEPFELYGYPEPLVWSTSRKASPLGSVYGGGVQIISFHSAQEKRDADWLEISPDGKSAKTIISRYSGGLNGDGIEVDLKKVGDDWYVVDLIERYVS